MRLAVIFFILLMSFKTYANLLSQLQVEEVFRQKLQNYITLYDDRAKVLVKFEYKKHQGDLPGTYVDGLNDIGEVADLESIKTANIFIISSHDNYHPSVVEVLKQMLPIASQKVNIKFQKMTPEMLRPEPETIKVSDIRSIAHDTFELFFMRFAILIAGLVVLSGIVMGIFQARKMREFKSQMSLLQEAFSANQAMPAFAPPVPEVSNSAMKSLNTSPVNSGHSQFGEKQINKMSVEQLLAVMSDCYWCESDPEASWIWNCLDTETKQALMQKWEPMKAYAKYLATVDPLPSSLYQDSYYLSPNDFRNYSNEDLLKVIHQKPEVWGALSLLRQRTIPVNLSLGLKLKDISTEFKVYSMTDIQPSAARVFESAGLISELSLEEEIEILNNPEFVPFMMRKNIPSLCWLATKEKEYVEGVLAKFDARSLATAWVGPAPLLEKLESYLPEKKAKSLRSSLSFSKPSRNSVVFRQLHELGVSHE